MAPASITWPSDDDIVAGCAEHGTRAAYSDALGVKPTSLSNHLRRNPKLRDRVNKALTKKPLKATKAVPTGEVSREETLAAEVAELRSRARNQRKGDVDRERLTQSIESALGDVPLPSRVGSAPRASRNPEAHHRQLVALSDWHGGEFVDPDAVNGLNEYSWDIMEERVEELIDGLLSHKENSPPLTGLDIALVGDMVSGHQHQELAETNEYPLAVQGVKMGHLLGQTIERLAPHYVDIHVVSVPGNHPRLKQKPAAKNVHDNMDWVAAMIAKEFLKGTSNVSVAVPTGGAILHTIAGRTFYIWHGDGIRSTMPGVPWGGVIRRVNEIRRSFAGTEIDFWLCGHFHQCNVMKGLGIFMNGSLKGTDEWVIKNFGGGSDPEQLILTFSERRGRLTDARFLTPSAGLPTHGPLHT